MSDTPPTDQPTAQGANFTSNDCGSQVQAVASGAILQPESGWLAINGNMDLSSCIVGNSNASISKLYVSNQCPRPIYNYCVWVYGQGPAGIGSGDLNLVFADETKSCYSLSLYSSTPGWHYVAYNSDSPGITQIFWGQIDIILPPGYGWG